MSDASDWTDASYATEPSGRRGLLLPFVLVLVIALGIATLGYVGYQLATRVDHAAGSLIAHTVHEKPSPDGAWTLVIDTLDKGALGGMTKIYLRPVGANSDGHETLLYDGEWLPDSAVRWRDARTVSVDGRLFTIRGTGLVVPQGSQ
jgi:hypothetical protein